MILGQIMNILHYSLSSKESKRIVAWFRLSLMGYYGYKMLKQFAIHNYQSFYINDQISIIEL